MSDTEMEYGGHTKSSTATPKLYITDHLCETPDAVELTFEILPAFNLRSTEVVLVELSIHGKLRGHRLIEGSSPDRKEIFTVPDNYWHTNQRDGPDAREACFHVTRGTLISQASGKPKSLATIKGSTYKILHRLISQDSHKDGQIDDNNTAERSKDDDAHHGSLQETFYDARSQFDNLPDTSNADEEPIDEDPVAAEEDSAAGDDSAAGGDSPSETRHTLTSSGTGKAVSIAASPTEDKVARLDRAKRIIFQDDASSSMEPVTTPRPSAVNASSPPVQDPDTAIFDDLAINAEQSENDEIVPYSKKPMQTFGTIDGFLSSSKTAAQYGITNHSVDPEDEADILVHNSKSLRRTSYAPVESAFQPDTSFEPADSEGTDNMALASKDGFTSDADEIEPAPTSKKNQDPAARKAARAKWAAAGGLAKSKLRTRVAENDRNIRDGKAPKLWKGKEDFGTDDSLNAANTRIEGVIKKQVKLHNLLSAYTDADAASDLRQRLKPWVKGGRIDEYESQLDAIFSTVQEAPSTDIVAPRQEINDDSAEGSSDDFALPSLNSQQRKMADFLLSKDQPARKTTEAATHESARSAQQVQLSTSPRMNSRDEGTPEDLDDDGLLDPSDLLPTRLPRGSLAKTQPVRDAGKSAERPQKRLRMK